MEELPASVTRRLEALRGALVSFSFHPGPHPMGILSFYVPAGLALRLELSELRDFHCGFREPPRVGLHWHFSSPLQSLRFATVRNYEQQGLRLHRNTVYLDATRAMSMRLELELQGTFPTEAPVKLSFEAARIAFGPVPEQRAQSKARRSAPPPAMLS